MSSSLYKNATNNWIPDYKEFKFVCNEAYELMLKQSQDRLSDLVSTSIKITDNAKNFLLYFIGGISAFISYVFSGKSGSQNTLTIILVSILMILCIIISFRLISFLKSRDVISAGSDPDEMLSKKVFDEVEETHKIILYSELVRYQTKINIVREKNKERMKRYNGVLYLFLISLAILPLIILFLS